MPLITPLENEEELDFIGRCMTDPTMLDEFEDEDQRLAVCYTQWEGGPPEEEPEEPVEDSVAEAIIKQGVSSDRQMKFIISNEDVDRDGDIVRQEGWDLAAFRTNPVFMAIHDRDKFPIGKFLDIGVQEKVLTGTVQFADKGTYEVADLAWDLYQQGIMKAVSVGFRPISPWEDNVEENEHGGFTYNKQELLEVSAVPVPANPKALAISKQYKQNTTDMLIKFVQQSENVKEEEANAEPEETNEDINKAIEAIRLFNNALKEVNNG